jgi:poly(hydroxyalkanoate) depolymerase family esterase
MQRTLLSPIPSDIGPLEENIAALVRPTYVRATAHAPLLREHTPSSWPYVDGRGPAILPVEKLVEETELASPGQFVDGSITNQAGTRTYKLYVPSCYDGQPLPLVVMLHGCKQDPDDFALGTRMNTVAEVRQCLVLYPEQLKTANNAKCWSWFSAADQERERGEPSLIADMTREIIGTYNVDESMVYVAGLSAGGAMAVIMANTYPDIFAAAAVHSGMPYNAAKSLFSALSAMKIGPRRREYDQPAPKTEGDAPAVPMIVFHGDADRVVHPMNGEQVVREAVATLGTGAPGAEIDPVAVVSVVELDLPERRSYTHTVYQDESGRNVAEQWVIHGSGHAWSGGSSDGSFTDPDGPDATHEMMRFFYEQKLSQPETGSPVPVRPGEGPSPQGNTFPCQPQ